MSSLCHRSCDKCSLKQQCQGCSYCEMPFCKEDCHQCFSLCPKRGSSFAYLKKLEEAEGIDTKLMSNERYDLPAHIAILPDRLTEALTVNEVIGIHAGNMFSSNGERITKGYITRGLKGAINTKNHVEGLLEFYVKDRTLEGLWDNRKIIYEQLKQFQWRAVIAPNFSVYEDVPRVDHIYNITRSRIVYNEMRQHNLPAVPDISWYNQIDLDNWIRDISSNAVKTISFSFQVVDVRLKASNLWKHYLMGFKYLCQRLNEDIQIIITGIVSPVRLQAVKRAAGKRRLIVLNQTAYVQSRRGVLSQTGEKAPRTMTKNQILLQNIQYFNAAYTKMNDEIYGG